MDGIRVLKCELTMTGATFADYHLESDQAILEAFKDFYFTHKESGERTPDRDDFYLRVVRKD